jgi:hypothetical protein
MTSGLAEDSGAVNWPILSSRILQQRGEHWAIVDLVCKGGHIRTVPVPDWVKATVDLWITAAGIAAKG